MTQTVLTFIAPIKEARRKDLENILAEVGAEPATNALVPFRQSNSLHFSSMVIFERPELRPILVWEANFDGKLEAWLPEMLAFAREGLHRIWSCCERYPGPDGLEGFLRVRAVPAGLYHIGSVGRSVSRIKTEANLRKALQSHLSHVSRTSAAEASRQLREYVGSDPAIAECLEFEPLLPSGQTAVAWIRTILALPIVFVELLLAVVILFKEPFDREDHIPIPHVHMRALLEREDRCALNHMASVTRVKPGIVRGMFLRLLLKFGNIAVRTQTDGTLNGIPGIHYAHWSLIDNGRWLLFLSNYSGSWTSYLDDFIERSSKLLTLLWSNTGGFPRTRWLFLGGAENGPLFKTYGRNSQSPHQVWYAAYPDLTVQELNKNSNIRNRLSTGVDSEEQQRTLLEMI
jgi:hypothetical protein